MDAYIAGTFLAVIGSCVIARLAAGRSGLWAWGLLGPPGWIIAALAGRLPQPGGQDAVRRPVDRGPPVRPCGHCAAPVPFGRTLCPACGKPVEE